MAQLYNYLVSGRYLKPVQILGRLRAFAQSRALHPFSIYRTRYRSKASGQEPFEPLQFSDIEWIVRNSVNSHNLDEIEGHIFTFLNRRVHLGDPIDWIRDGETKLWQYNLHYFDYSVALGWLYANHRREEAYQLFRRLALQWIDSCPVATSISWDSYPLSLRISNWIKSYTLFLPALQEDAIFAAELRRSLYVQTCFLENHLEYRILGNHLIENARALLLSGLFFKSARSRRWQKRGKKILWTELREQFLGDGGHFERSPMYHEIMLNLYREVCSLLRSKRLEAPPELVNRIQAMENWLQDVLHPDGKFALVNDTALADLGNRTALGDKRMVPSDGLKALSDSGYFIFRGNGQGPRNEQLNGAKQALGTNGHRTFGNGFNDHQDFLLFDCGPVGPDYLPAHGHCDTLSYELSLAGKRFIVDSGVGDYYGDLDWRSYYRSTRAHNTVVVDGAEQSEIWGRFRMARRAHPVDVRWKDQGSELAFACGGHSGYRRLRGKVGHRRWICWIDRHFWLVCDHITGKGRHCVESLIHFHPEVEIVRSPACTGKREIGTVQRGNTVLKILPWEVGNIASYYGETDPIQGWMAPEFGLKHKNVVWGLHQESELPIWFGYLLWPEQTDVEVQTKVLAKNAYQICVRTEEKQYEIICSPFEVKLERKP